MSVAPDISPVPLADRVFGYRFGRARITEPAQLAGLHDAIARAAFDCLFVHTALLELAPVLAQASPKYQVLSAQRVEMVKRGAGLGTAPAGTCSRLLAPGPALDIAAEAFTGSRFAMDGRLAAKEGEWFRELCRRGSEPPRQLLGYRDADGPAGFLAGGSGAEGSAECELVGVAASRRATGVGRALVEAWEASLPPDTTVHAWVPAGYHPARTFFNRLGYTEGAQEIVATIWCV